MGLRLCSKPSGSFVHFFLATMVKNMGETVDTIWDEGTGGRTMLFFNIFFNIFFLCCHWVR